MDAVLQEDLSKTFRSQLIGKEIRDLRNVPYPHRRRTLQF
jgi:hypothetical protein